jgi:DNA topoisomerase IA
MPKTKITHLVRNPRRRNALREKRLWLVRGLSKSGNKFSMKVRADTHSEARERASKPGYSIRDVVLIEEAKRNPKRRTKSRRPRVTVANKNLRRTDRSPQQYIIEAMQEKANRRFKFWYWDGARLTTDKGAAQKFVSVSQAQPIARRILVGVPSSILYVRVVKA